MPVEHLFGASGIQVVGYHLMTMRGGGHPLADAKQASERVELEAERKLVPLLMADVRVGVSG